MEPHVYAFTDEEAAVFPVFDSRATDLVLGLVIGLSFAMVWHVVVLVVR